MENSSPKKTEPIKRNQPKADLYETPNFGDEVVNKKIAELQQGLKDSLKDSRNKFAQCLAYNNLGTAYFRLFKYDAAEICFDLHLQIAKESTHLITFGNKSKYEAKTAIINLGCTYHMKKEYELALQTFREAIDLADELNDKASKARILSNMSNIYEDCCDFDSAIECQNQRMELVTELCDINGQIKSAATLGCLYCLTGQIRKSLENYDKVITNLRMKIVQKKLGSIFDTNADENIQEDPAFYDKEVIQNK
ncbi:tetratricopeptide repeat protein 28 isoform X1 [Hydra vulgaris]|uniref:tetratricopeptide repeat protein 28 isoform X1 n=1 Tax=Hydra vulgaris TaxID=6087 RepID=UPI000640C543|nr:tetratricopeptide repeat protein 28 [Hydra vulgaris]XP_047128964.1 tetratricopeptide repeat protein 28 [Hydra vulgaris]XP_047128965.1 tetratricopeptide repeat protein 28 [Hydra vulgaris]